MRTMIACTVRCNVIVVVRIVECKWYFRRLVDLRSGRTDLLFLYVKVIVRQNIRHIVLRQRRRIRCLLKQWVADLQTAVHDGDDHALALIAGGVLQTAQLGHGGGHIRRYLEHRCRISRRNAVQCADFIQFTVGNRYRKTILYVRIGVQHLEWLAVEDLIGNLSLYISLLEYRDRTGFFLQYNNRRDLFIRRNLLR